MNYLEEIIKQIQPLVNWAVFVLVIAIGYFVRVTPVLLQHSKTLKIFILSFIITLAYAISEQLSPGVYLVSYFTAFGFHSAILKVLEKKLKTALKKYTNGSE